MLRPSITIARTSIAVLLIVSGTSTYSQGICDPTKPIVNDGDRYRLRDNGDRCEGIYGEQPVGGDVIRDIVSFTRGELRYEIDAEKPLTIEWSVSPDQPLRLRAESVKEDLLYQMDTQRAPEPRIYDWPISLLVQHRIKPADLALRGWIPRSIGGRSRSLHLPLSVRQGDIVPRLDAYVVGVVPEVNLIELKVVVEQLGDDGRPTDRVWERTYSKTFPNFQAIRFGLPPPSEPGIYLLRVIGKATDNHQGTELFWFQHVGS